MSCIVLLSYIIAIFGICELLIYFNGPFNIIGGFRKIMTSISSGLGELFSCFACLSTWIGGMVSLINILFISVPITPFNFLLGTLSHMWWFIIPMDAAFACGTTWMLHQLEELMERIGDNKEVDTDYDEY